jgi:hypothetical protein
MLVQCWVVLCFRFFIGGSVIELYFSFVMVLSNSRNSSIGTATGYGLDGRGSIPGRGKKYLSRL